MCCYPTRPYRSVNPDEAMTVLPMTSAHSSSHTHYSTPAVHKHVVTDRTTSTQMSAYQRGYGHFFSPASPPCLPPNLKMPKAQAPKRDSIASSFRQGLALCNL